MTVTLVSTPVAIAAGIVLALLIAAAIVLEIVDKTRHK
jgi:hypothetical protein